LKSSDIKDVAEPIKVDQWNVIIRLESREESNLDESMKQRMAEEIFDEILEVETTQKVNEMLKEAEII
jgi:parvulin-like peptidyl-prolyl isomerase